jgi:diguanylate cyclase (GGDEF)-like protein
MADYEVMAAGAHQPAGHADRGRFPETGRHALPGRIRRLNPVTAGRGLLLLTVVVVGATLPLLKPSKEDWGAALAVELSLLGFLLLSAVLPWRRWSPTTTLAFPIVTMMGLGALGLAVDDGRAMAYAGIFLLCFAYLGLMHPPGTFRWVLPPALVCYAGMADSLAPPIIVRMCIVSVVWIVLAELLSRLARHNEAMTADLQHSLATDPLTGVGSRRALEERMSRLSQGDALVLVDLDHFKAVNDQYGHSVGDEVLQEFGSILRTRIRPHDFVARYGGEEFVLVLARTGPDQAREVLARVRSEWRRARPDVTFSSGLAVNTDMESEAQILLAMADAALYRAKAAGRNRDVVADPDERQAQPPT